MDAEHDAILAAALVTAVLSFLGVVLTSWWGKRQKREIRAAVNKADSESYRLNAETNEHHLEAYQNLLEAWQKGEAERIEMAAQVKALREQVNGLTEKVATLEIRLEEEHRLRVRAESELRSLRQRMNIVEGQSDGTESR